MSKPTSLIRMPEDLPTLLDDLIRRDDIPGTGQFPRELEELNLNNYLYLYGKEAEAPKLDLQSMVTERDFSAWRLSLDALRPEWATLAFHPRPANPRPVQFLRRRNGKVVVPDFVIGNDDRKNF